MRFIAALLALAAGCAATSSRYDTLLGDVRRDERAHAHADAAVAALAAAPTLDRRALIAAVLAANREVEAMRQAWRAAVAEVPAAGAFDDPMLDYAIAPLSIASSDAPFGQRIELRQKLPFPGKRALAADAATADAEAMRGDYEATRLMVAELASQLYDDAYLNARGVEVNEHHRKLVEQMKKAAELRVASGRASTQDALQAEVELGHLEHERAMLDTERIAIDARLNGLLHRDPAAPLPPAPSELALPPEPPPLATLEQSAVATRPQRDAAEARLHAAEAGVAGARRAYYPDVELMGSYDSMWDLPEHRWMAGIGIEVPLQRGRRAAEVTAANARVAAAKANVERAVDEIRVEVVRAHRELVEALHVAKLYDDRLLPAARAEVDAALAGFTTGANDFPTVISAERELREIQLAAYRTHADAWKRQAALDRAVGRSAGGAP